MHRPLVLVAVALALGALNLVPAQEATPVVPSDARPASTLLDLSGLAWIGCDAFLAVHDAKNPDELDRPRLSLVWAATSPAGVRWQPLDLAWPDPGGPSSDLESAAAIPGTSLVLLAESGEEATENRPFRRLFLVEIGDGGVRLVSTVDWPASVANVEGSAVARIGERFVFLYAERAEGEAGSTLRWAELTVDPLGFGPFAETPLPGAEPAGPGVRPVSAIEVDAAGSVYVASAFDPGDDGGPFRSEVRRVGLVVAGAGGAPEVEVAAEPEPVAILDGVKVESLAARPGPDGAPELFVGTDDEDYGAMLRPLPPTLGPATPTAATPTG